MDALSTFFSGADFMPHGTCFLWRTEILLLHAISDSLIVFAYYSIPVALVYFASQRRDLDFRWMFILFGMFILACGTTHLMAIWTLWWPDYAAEGLVKAVTAAVSVATAVLVWRVMPAALAIPSKTALAEANRALCSEIGERRLAEKAVREANALLEQRVAERTAALEQANRELRAEVAERQRAEKWFRLAVDASPGGLVMVDSGGTIVLANVQAERIFGYGREELLGQKVEMLVPEALREQHRLDRSSYLKSPKKRPMGSARHLAGRHKSGREFPLEIGLNPIQMDDGVFVLSAVVDITERQTAENRTRLLIDELNHRVKNTLATVRSLVNAAVRTSDNPADALKVVEGRLEALANAHDLLSASRWEGAELRLILERELSPYHSGDHHVRLNGPAVTLEPRSATAVVMTIHELATNAAKYGALSVPDGRVDVCWEVSGSGSDRRLLLTWEEAGGPRVEQPKRRGFGSRLIAGRVPHEVGGTSSLEFREGGVVCQIEVPLPQLFDPERSSWRRDVRVDG